MRLKKWSELPQFMQNENVLPYFEVLQNKQLDLLVKRVFDIVCSFILILLMLPLFITVAIFIKIDSVGPVFYFQERVTQYGRIFKIIKFRTMVKNADYIGTQVTVDNDARITRVGMKIRKYRIDEIPQLFNILKGEMTFVGTRPEVDRYVKEYTNEMYATLLLPAGVTSLASIMFKDEDKMLNDLENIDYEYINKVLPAKMKYNFSELINFSLKNDVIRMIQTLREVIS